MVEMYIKVSAETYKLIEKLERYYNSCGPTKMFSSTDDILNWGLDRFLEKEFKNG